MFYVGVKYLITSPSFSLLRRTTVTQIDEQDNFQEAKNLVFDFLDGLKIIFLKHLNNFLHWLLHFFVIFLKWLSVFTDYMYEKSRDFFLATASKEKEIVATFWHTLKEYKKEKDVEKQ